MEMNDMFPDTAVDFFLDRLSIRTPARFTYNVIYIYIYIYIYVEREREINRLIDR